MQAELEARFQSFVTARWTRLVRTAYLLTGDLHDAEDLARTAVAAAYRSWRRVLRCDDPEAYLRRMLVTCNNDRFRRRRVADRLAAVPPDTGGRDPGVLGADERNALMRALAELSARQRAVVVMRYWEGLSEAEVADVLGCAPGTVGSRASEALAKLRAHPGPAQVSNRPGGTRATKRGATRTARRHDSGTGAGAGPGAGTAADAAADAGTAADAGAGAGTAADAGDGAGAASGAGALSGNGTAADAGADAGEGLKAFEAGLRQRLAQNALALQPSAPSHPAIVRQGRQERRRRLAAAGAALVVLAVASATAVTLADGGDRAAAGPAAGGGPGASAPGPRTAPAPAGATAPATPGQLADGITPEQASRELEQCLQLDRQRLVGGSSADLGKAAAYRLLLAQRRTGTDGSPGGHVLVAVNDTTETRLICTSENGAASGVTTHVGSQRTPESGAVVPDVTARSLYVQRFGHEGPWRLPYRWGSIGTYDFRVAKVTVTYGGTTVEAALDHGWYAATGVLDLRITRAPRVKGYDTRGVLVYDSEQDPGYDKPLP